MGIKNLNRFLREQSKQSKESIKFISVAELSGKKIAIDISIYMYKYASEGSLLENIYLMLSVFRYYNICPIFVFDGKPPPEKKELLLKRKEDKIEAESEYNKLKSQLEKNIVDDIEKQDIIAIFIAEGVLPKNFLDLKDAPVTLPRLKNEVKAYISRESE